MFEDKLHDRDELLRDNEFLRVQLRSMEQKFERYTSEYSKQLEESHQQEHEASEHIQALMDEIERIKRDLVLEEYRKQEAERKVRYYDEKIKSEHTVNKKMQQDFLQLKQELKSMHLRYDSLQIEMLAMHKANHNDTTLIPTRDTSESDWPKKRAIDREIVSVRAIALIIFSKMAFRTSNWRRNVPNGKREIEPNHLRVDRVVSVSNGIKSRRSHRKLRTYVLSTREERMNAVYFLE